MAEMAAQPPTEKWLRRTSLLRLAGLCSFQQQTVAGVLQGSVLAYRHNRVIVVGDVRAGTDWKAQLCRLRDLGVVRESSQ